MAIFWYHWYNYLTGSRWLTQTPNKQGHKKKSFNTQQQWLFTTNLIQLMPVFLDTIMFLLGKCDLAEEEKSHYKTTHLCLSVHLATRGLLEFLQEEMCLILWCCHIGKQPHTHNLIKALFYLKFQNDTYKNEISTIYNEAITLPGNHLTTDWNDLFVAFLYT